MKQMTKRQEAALETKKKLMKAARRIVSERGLAGTQVEEITKLCGVSKGTFYTYFKRKEDVIYAICWKKFEVIRDAALASRKPFPSRLSDYMKEFCTYIEDESLKLCQEWIRNTADPEFAGNRDGIDKLNLDLEAVTSLFEDGIRREEIKENAPVGQLSRMLVDVMYGEMLCWATSNGKIRFSDRTREFCGNFLESLLKPYLKNKKMRKKRQAETPNEHRERIRNLLRKNTNNKISKKGKTP